MNPPKPTTADRFADRRAMLAVMQRAVDAAKWKHALLGGHLCVWNEGQLEWIEAKSDGTPPESWWYEV